MIVRTTHTVIVALTLMAVASCSAYRLSAQPEKSAQAQIEKSSDDKVAVNTNVPSKIRGDAVRYPGMPDFPAVAMILKKDGNRFVEDCTGTLVSRNVLLTAGHCICTTQTAQYGTYEKCGISKTYASESAKPNHLQTSNYLVFFQHSGFYRVKKMDVFRDAAAGVAYNVHVSNSAYVGDLGVLVLDREVENVKPADRVSAAFVAPATTESKNSNAVVVGFGQHRFGDGNSDLHTGIKLHALTKVLPKGAAACVQGSVPNGAICATAVVFDQEPGGAICKGDSGGPLFAYTPLLAGPMTKQPFQLWGVNNSVLNCYEKNQGRHMDLSNGMYAKWIDGMVKKAEAELASSSGSLAKDRLAPVFNDDSRYFIIDPKTSAGIFEKGFAVLDDTGQASQTFEVKGATELMRISANRTSVKANAPEAVGALSLRIEKLSGSGSPFTPRTICNRSIVSGGSATCAAPAGAEVPAITSGIFPVTPGTYRAVITGDKGRAVQFVATGYLRPNSDLASSN